MAASVVDPGFNNGQVAVAPTTLTTPISANSNDAVAVQPDGKIVVAGAASTATSNDGSFQVSVRRTLADGTPDPSFGTGGQVVVSIPAGSATSFSLAESILVQTSGRIVLDVNRFAVTSQPFLGSSTTYFGSDVVALTANGTLDANFGTGGIASVTTDNPSFNDLASLPNDQILLGGLGSNPTAAPPGTRTALLVQLGANGLADPTFNGGAPRFLDAITPATGSALYAVTENGFGVTTTGKIKVVANFTESIGNTGDGRFGVVQLNGDGSYDSTYGTGGVTTTPNPTTGNIIRAVVLPSGQVVEAVFGGLFSPTNTLTRLNADGTTDTAFGTPSVPFSINTLAVAPDGSVVVGSGTNFAAPSIPTLELDVTRVTAAGRLDTNFAPGGIARIAVPNAAFDSTNSLIRAGVIPTGFAFTADGRIVVAGTTSYASVAIGTFGSSASYGSQSLLAVVRPVNHLAGMNGDYDGDNKSDLAAELTALGLFAYRASSGTGDVVQPFGDAGPGKTIPAPGDYDGDGKTDVAAYLPAYGILAYRASSGTGDHLVRFGPTGNGAAVPVPGDYDGDGKTDVALFVPAEALYLIDPSGGGAPYAVQFGAAGAGQSIPVPGDYDGDGKTDLAVYIPVTGQLIERGSSGTGDIATAFGPPGLDASIPVAGDFDGDGRADVAVFLPSTSTFAIDPSGGGAPYAVQFGAAGLSVPITGDFDGDGKTDLAVAMAGLTTFAYRPSGGGADVLEPFGTGDGSTVPASALPSVLPASLRVDALSLRAPDPSAGLVFYLPDAPARKKPTA